MTRHATDPGHGSREHGPRIVSFSEPHAAAVLELIGAVFAEYAMTFEPSGYDVDLTAIHDHYFALGGWFALLLDAGQVVGTAAVVPKDAAVCELKRLYLRPEYRGRGHGAALLDAVLAWAAAHGFRTIVAWSDARLPLAHRMYERLGFQRFGERVADDVDRSREYGFRRPVGGAP